MPEELKNYGLINEDLQGDEEVLGSSDDGLPILQKDRDWLPFLSPKEYQALFHETWNCTVFSMLNCLETYGRRRYGLKLEKSDRFTGKMSGTIPRYGNTLRKSFESLPRDGWVDEEVYPFDSKTVEEYYKAIPQEIKDKALKEGKQFVFKRKVLTGEITAEKLWEALQYAPVRVTVKAWEKPVNGVYQRAKDDTFNHAVMLFLQKYGERSWVFDQYDQVVKELAWDFKFGSADIITFELKNMDNEFVKIVGDKTTEESRAVGFFIPATNPEAFKSMALAYNKEIHYTEKGDIDWDKTIEGSLKLKI